MLDIVNVTFHRWKIYTDEGRQYSGNVKLMELLQWVFWCSWSETGISRVEAANWWFLLLGLQYDDMTILTLEDALWRYDSSYNWSSIWCFWLLKLQFVNSECENRTHGEVTIWWFENFYCRWCWLISKSSLKSAPQLSLSVVVVDGSKIDTKQSMDPKYSTAKSSPTQLLEIWKDHSVQNSITFCLVQMYWVYPLKVLYTWLS